MARADAVVVGGGPSGLASARVLADRGFDVTVLERRSEPSPYEPQRAYLYLIDGRGQQFTDMAGITHELSLPENSVPSTKYIGMTQTHAARLVRSWWLRCMLHPALFSDDPRDFDSRRCSYTVTRCMPEGERVEAVPPILDPAMKRPSYWIPRAAFLSLLHRSLPSSVTTLFGSEVSDIRRTESGGVEVSAKDADGNELRLRPSLLVGADGLSSLVRERCASWSDDAADFTPVVLPSPSSGLCYKMIRLPPSFRLDKADALITAEPRKAYSIRPAKSAPLGPTRLGLLPVADPSFPRTANVILPPEHPVWGLESAEAVREWLGATFPTLPVDAVVDAEEAAAFVDGRPGAFPSPCYSPQQQLMLAEAGVVLVGDAIHAFPPDVSGGVSNPSDRTAGA